MTKGKTKKQPDKRRGKKAGDEILTAEALRQNVEKVCGGKKTSKPADTWMSTPRKIDPD